MSSLAIFLYGTFVFALVTTALGLIAWGIVIDRRSRLSEETRAPARSAVPRTAVDASVPTPNPKD